MKPNYIIEKLKNKETVSFRPHGNSMTPKIYSGNLVTISPIEETSCIEVGDVVYCKVNGRIFLHLVTAVRSNNQYQISNNKGHVNGWTTIDKIYGKLIKIEP